LIYVYVIGSIVFVLFSNIGVIIELFIVSNGIVFSSTMTCRLVTVVVVLSSVFVTIGIVIDVLFVGLVIMTSILLVSTVGFVKSVCVVISGVNSGIVTLLVLVEIVILFCEISLYYICSYTGVVCGVSKNCKFIDVILL
jgi:hypothetical protein